jgi:hypothetical protein
LFITGADFILFGVGAGPWTVVFKGADFLFFGTGSGGADFAEGPWTDPVADRMGAGDGAGAFGSCGGFLFLSAGAELLDFNFVASWWADVASASAVSFVADIQLLFCHLWVRLMAPRSSNVLVSSSFSSSNFLGADRLGIFLVTALAFVEDVFVSGDCCAKFAFFMEILILGLGLGKGWQSSRAAFSPLMCSLDPWVMASTDRLPFPFASK